MKTIKSYLTGLKSLHIDLGLSTEPFGNHCLQGIIRGINRFHGEPNNKERLPTTRGLLIRILSLLDANDPVMRTSMTPSALHTPDFWGQEK